MRRFIRILTQMGDSSGLQMWSIWTMGPVGAQGKLGTGMTGKKLTSGRGKRARARSANAPDSVRPILPDDGGRAMPGTVPCGSFQIEGARYLPDLCHVILDHLGRGVILLAADGRIIDANKSARDMLAAGEALSSKSGRLAFSDPVQDLKLQRLLSKTSSSKARARGFALQHRKMDGQRPLRVLISPLPESSAQSVAFLAFVFRDPEEVQIIPDLLRELHGLSTAEAEVASRLFAGHSVEETAQILGLSTNTIRTQLKHVFAKCGVQSQAELLHLLALGPRNYR